MRAKEHGCYLEDLLKEDLLKEDFFKSEIFKITHRISSLISKPCNMSIKDIFRELVELFTLSDISCDENNKLFLCSKIYGCIAECYKFGIGIEDSDSKYSEEMIKNQKLIDNLIFCNKYVSEEDKMEEL